MRRSGCGITFLRRSLGHVHGKEWIRTSGCQGCIVHQSDYYGTCVDLHEMVELVHSYGIPVLIPGQIISGEMVDYIIQHVDASFPVKGPEDPGIQEIKVVSYEKKDAGRKKKNGYLIPD